MGAAGEDSEDADEVGEHDLMEFTDQALEGEQNESALYLKALLLMGIISSLLPHPEMVELRGLGHSVHSSMGSNSKFGSNHKIARNSVMNATFDYQDHAPM